MADTYQEACLTLARSLASHRVAQNLTQEELARISGVHANTICRMECGPFSSMFGPTLRTMVRLSDALGVPLSVLLTQVDEA